MRYYFALLLVSMTLVTSVSAQDTVQVFAGWNLIGSVKAGAVPDVLSTIPDSLISSSFWGYAPGVGYESTDTLDNGVGYWVKVKEDGLIVFSATPTVDSCKSKAFIYQGKLYNTVSIGNQCWMAENLDVGTLVAGITNQTDNDTTEMYCYNNDPINCTLYGGLYQWSEAMQSVTTPGTQGICPAGWHIPTDAEFGTLDLAVGGDGNSLKAVGQGVGAGAGTNASGFSALLAGSRYSNYGGGFGNLGYFAYFWSSTELQASDAYYLNLSFNNINIYFSPNETEGFTVRCLED